MKIIYCTLNNIEEARSISRKLLEEKLCNCTNFFPINCMYNWKGKIEEEPEVVLIIKTLEGKFEEIEKGIKASISYTNFIGELNVENLNYGFTDWRKAVVK